MSKIILILGLLWMRDSIARDRCFGQERLYFREVSKTQFKNNWESCSRQFFLYLNMVPRTLSCLLETYSPNLTSQCLSCFAESSQCMRSNCKTACALGRNAFCENCAIRYCQDSLMSCSGLSLEELP